MRRGKYWESDTMRQARAEVKRSFRRSRNMRNAVRQGTHKRVVISGTQENPGRIELVPLVEEKYEPTCLDDEDEDALSWIGFVDSNRQKKEVC